MSFSLSIKNEVINLVNNKHCAAAELFSIISYIGKIEVSNNKNFLKIQSENKDLIQKVLKLYKTIFSKDLILNNLKNKTYYTVIENNDFIENNFLNLNESTYYEKILNSNLLDKTCCKRAFIRGAFICIGYIADPEKNYHLEFVNSSFIQADNLKEIIKFFDIDAKIIEKKDLFIVYIKEGEQIVDLLNIIEAHKALLKLENIRILKDVRNNINRIVNCETANLNKIISSGINQKEDIELIQSKIGLDSLKKQLKEVAKLRLENPDISLRELGEMLNPPISKSGINHRLKRINIIAENLRGNINDSKKFKD